MGYGREDYSQDGNAWDYFSHDQARSRAYHRGEDGLGGVSDEKQFLCFALALWNGRDPILKERLFGLTNSEGNHGEDVKEYYFYLDSTPTHSYMKYLYKYPQAAFPYDDLVATNKARSRAKLFAAIEQALAGKTSVTPLVTKGMPLGVFLRRATKPATEKLTARQREVLQLLADPWLFTGTRSWSSSACRRPLSWCNMPSSMEC